MRGEYFPRTTLPACRHFGRCSRRRCCRWRLCRGCDYFWDSFILFRVLASKAEHLCLRVPLGHLRGAESASILTAGLAALVDRLVEGEGRFLTHFYPILVVVPFFGFSQGCAFMHVVRLITHTITEHTHSR